MKISSSFIPALFVKLLFSSLLALMLVACSSGSSGSSNSSAPSAPSDTSVKFDFEQSQITVKYRADLTIDNRIIVRNIDLGQVRYKSDTTRVATVVDNGGLLSIRAVGTATITVTRSTNSESTQVRTAEFLLTVTKGDQAPLVFDKSFVSTEYSTNKDVVNRAQGGTGSGAITYSIDDTNVATIATHTAVVTLKSRGKATVTATKAADANYTTISNSYILMANNKKDQKPDLSFARDAITLDYQVGGITTSNIAQGGTGTEAISYRIDNKEVATIDANTGEVTIKSAGKARITATKAGDDTYNSTEVSYILTVNKIAQTDFRFASSSTITLTYRPGATTSNIAAGGQGKGKIRYSIDNTDVAIIDADNGIVTIYGAGVAIITATKAGDTNYQAITTSTVLVVNKAQQTGFRFAQASIAQEYVQDETISNVAEGGQGRGAIIYSIDNTSVATIDEDTGELTIKSTGTATVTAIRAGDSNYLSTSATYSLRILTPFITLGIKNIKFAWDNIVDTDHYRLLADLGRGGGFVDASATGFIVTPNSTNIKQTNARADIALHRYIPLVNGPQYLVEPCDSSNVCSSSTTISGSLSNEQLNQLIGYIKASNTDTGDFFGWSVSLSGDGNSLAVGANREDSNAEGIDGNQDNNDDTWSGAVYIFSRSSTGIWSQQAYIKASNTDAGDRFGFSVSLDYDGNSLAVGARQEDSSVKGIDGAQNNNNSNDTGAVYVFSRSSTGTWSQQAYIKARNTGAGDQFGYSVSLSDDGNSLAVGAINEDSNSTGVGDLQNNNSTNTGAVYVFSRSGIGTWSQQSYIKASNTDANDLFGISVSLSDDGNSLAVGATNEDSNAKGVNGEQNDDSAENSGGSVCLYSPQ